MIDFTLFGFTLALLVVGVWHACTSANISGQDDVQDDGCGPPPPPTNVVRFARRQRQANARTPRGT